MFDYAIFQIEFSFSSPILIDVSLIDISMIFSIIDFIDIDYFH